MKGRRYHERLTIGIVRRRVRGGQRKIGKPELIALAHDYGAIDRILDLADIAGPIELRKVRHRLAADAGNRTIFLSGEPRQKMPQQMRDVLAPRAQWRDRPPQHGQAIEQVFAKLSAFYAVEQSAVSRGNDANVDLYRLARADR